MSCKRSFSFRLLPLIVLLPLAAAFACSAQSSDLEAIRGLTRRIVPEWASRIDYKIIPGAGDGYSLQSQDGKLLITGNSANSLATGLNYYLKYYCHSFVSWHRAMPLQLPKAMPEITGVVHRQARSKTRFFLNYCTYGYTMPWWGWQDWEHFIDWMALNGVNMPLAITGQEAIWYKVWRQFGLSDSEIRHFFTGPAYLPWHRMANIDAWDGPLPTGWLDSQLKLQQKILARERSLDMTPVLPAFAGHVPAALKSRYPTAKINTLGKWGGFPDQYHASFLDPLDPLFKKIQHAFLEQQTKLFGTDHIYGADPFNEVTPPSWDPSYLATVSRVIYQSMEQVDPQARWLQMGWIFYYQRSHWTNIRIDSFLRAVPQDKMILLDYYDEKTEIWKITDRFFNQPYIWCYLGNFGGNTSLAGNLDTVEARMEDAYQKGGSNLWGVGSTLEGFDVNPLMYDYVLEKAWSTGPLDVNAWIRHWAMLRCGASDPSVEKAWAILHHKVYVSAAVHRSPLTNARPSFTGVGKWASPEIDYDNRDLLRAWGLMLQSSQRDRATYQYDIANIGRQVMGNYFTVLRDRFTADYKDHNLSAMSRDSARMIGLIHDMDTLVGTQSSFLLGKWLHDAEALGTTPQEKRYYEKDARNILTTWGGADQSLNDYANRCWSGLLNDFYATRWKMFTHDALNAVRAGDALDEKAFHKAVTDYEWRWVNQTGTYKDTPSGDAFAISQVLYRKYRPEIMAAGAHAPAH